MPGKTRPESLGPDNADMNNKSRRRRRRRRNIN
jgi:hypothetical protein